MEGARGRCLGVAAASPLSAHHWLPLRVLILCQLQCVMHLRVADQGQSVLCAPLKLDMLCMESERPTELPGRGVTASGCLAEPGCCPACSACHPVSCLCLDWPVYDMVATGERSVLSSATLP